MVQARRRQRLHRYTDTHVPQSPWRHLPIAVSLLCLALLTIALATPTHDMRIPRNRAVIMLVIDMSQSMRATDVEPNRLKAAEQAATQFAGQLTPGINLGLVGFAGTPYLLVPPTPQHQATIDALKKLDFADSTATGEAIFTALHAIDASRSPAATPRRRPASCCCPTAARTSRTNPSDPHDGAFTAARLAKDKGVPISTISFGTKSGDIELDGQRINVPVSTDQMKTIAKLSGGQSYTATNLGELKRATTPSRTRSGIAPCRGRAVPGGCASAC